jgi:hypothetical protein
METEHTPGPWAVGQYTATESFKSIDNHTCVCVPDTMLLIATCGPADDLKSQRDADVIAAAPDYYEACRDPKDDVSPLSWLASLLSSVEPHLERISGGDLNAGWMCLQECRTLLAKLQAATKKADGTVSRGA